MKAEGWHFRKHSKMAKRYCGVEGILYICPGTAASIIGSSGNQPEDKADVIEEGRASQDRCKPQDLDPGQ